MRSAFNKFALVLILSAVVVLMYKFINRDSLMYAIQHSLPPKEASVLAGMLLGVKDFEKQFYGKLKDVGLVHLMVASGANIALVARLTIEKLAGLLGRKTAIGWGMAAIWGYAAMVGWEAPIVRAAILISIYYWAQILGRKYNILTGIGMTVGVMLAANWEFASELSFWLSVTTFGAIAVRDRSGEKREGVFKEDLRTTLWVSLWISPILSLVFGEFSLVSPAVNAFCLFAVEYISVVGFIGVISYLVWPLAGNLMLMLIYPFLKYLVIVSEGVGSLGWIKVRVDFNWYLFAGWYSVLLYVLLKRKNEGKNMAFV